MTGTGPQETTLNYENQNVTEFIVGERKNKFQCLIIISRDGPTGT